MIDLIFFNYKRYLISLLESFDKFLRCCQGGKKDEEDGLVFEGVVGQYIFSWNILFRVMTCFPGTY